MQKDCFILRFKKPKMEVTNMKRLLGFFILSIFFIISVSISLNAQTTQKPIELNFAISDPPTHYYVKNVYSVWAQELEKRTGGRLRIIVYAGETLGKQAEQYDLLLKGAAHLITLIGPQYPGRFPLSDVFNLPFLIPPDGPNSPGKVIRDMVYEKYLNPIHFKDVKVLWKSRFQPNVLHMAKKPVRTIKDIKGQIIGIPGGKILASFLKLLGASPELSPSPEVYTNLEKGIINGQILPFETQLGLRLSEVAKFVTMTNQGSASLCIAMRKQTWEVLPPDIQKIVLDTNPWAEDLIAKVNITTFERILGMSKRAGVEIIELPPEEKAHWVEATKAVEKEWVKEMDSKGLPGTAMYNDILKFLAK